MKNRKNSLKLLSQEASNAKVLISSGVRTFHLPYLAGALNDKPIDFLLLTGLYPTKLVKFAFFWLPYKAKLKLFSREQTIDSYRIRLSILSEAFAHILQLSRQLKVSQKVINLLTKGVHYTFAMKAKSIISAYRPSIYHYRCSYGLFSLNNPNIRNTLKLCDHSIAHPYLVDHYINNNGVLGNLNTASSNPSNELVYDLMNQDLIQADHILVNSNFVRESMIQMGINGSKVSVIELAVEDKFMSYISHHANTVSKRKEAEVLFAGSWIPRKGINSLSDAIEILSGKVRLRIAGVSRNDFLRYCLENKITESYYDPLGYLSREELCNEMLQSRIFVFPSLCEGFAKTVQEAMACGCFIIATENSGFSSDNGAHGSIVRPGRPDELASAILSALQNPLLDKYCIENMEYARLHYSSQNYADSVAKLYSKLLNSL